MILESCAKHGVSQLKLGPLEVAFGGPIQSLAQIQPPGATQPATSPENVIQAQHTEERNAQEEQEVAARESQVAELLITDPYLAEQLAEKGELTLPEAGDAENDGNDA
jgi:hypothetical protein